MGAFSDSQIEWLKGLLGSPEFLVRRSAAETLGESSIHDSALTQEVIRNLNLRGLAASGWQRRDLEHLYFDTASLEKSIEMAMSFEQDRHDLAIGLILLHPPETLLGFEQTLLKLPDLTRIEYELLKEALGFYRSSSDKLWNKVQSMAAGMAKYPMFPRRIKETVKAMTREVARRPYPLNRDLIHAIEHDPNPWLRGLSCMILAARSCRSAAPLILKTLVESQLLELNEFAEEALVTLQDEAIIEQLIDEFPHQSHEYRVVTNPLFYRMPFPLTLKHAARLAEGEEDNVAYGLLLTYCRAFDRLGLERNYSIARSMPQTSELAFLGVESLGYATALSMDLHDHAYWLAEAQQVGLFDEAEESKDEFSFAFAKKLYPEAEFRPRLDD